MKTGKIKFYLTDGGYGFVTPDDGGPDLFFHVTGLKEGFEPEKNKPVSYQEKSTKKGINAVDVGDVMP